MGMPLRRLLAKHSAEPAFPVAFAGNGVSFGRWRHGVAELQRLTFPDTGRFGLGGHFGSGDCRSRILFAEAAGGFYAGAVGDVFIAALEVRGTPLEVVGVGGQEVNPVAVQQFVGEGLSGVAEAPVKRGGGDLDDAAHADPLGEQFGTLDDDRVALGVGDDVGVADGAEALESVSELGRDGRLGELDQQIAFAADRIPERMAESVLDIVGVEVEIAGQDQLDSIAEPGLDFGHALDVHFGLIGVTVHGVRTARDVGDAFGNCHFSHGQRGFEIFRAIIHVVDEVMMNVDHFRSTFRLSDSGAQVC